MTSYGLDEWFRAMFEPTWTWPNFMFGQLFMWIGANYGQIWLHIGYMSDSEQCSDRLELYLISLLVNFSCELGQIMTRYDFLWLDEWFSMIHFLIALTFLHRGAVLLEEYICRVNMAYMGKLGQLRVNITK